MREAVGRKMLMGFRSTFGSRDIDISGIFILCVSRRA